MNNNFFKKRHNPPALMQIFHYYHNYIELPKKAKISTIIVNLAYLHHKKKFARFHKKSQLA